MTTAVYIRTDGGPQVGFGHLRRSWTLAARLRQDLPGADIRFAAASPDAAAGLRASEFPIVTESAPDRWDALATLLERAAGPVVCLVDDPAFSPEGMASLRRAAPVVCVDDPGERAMPVDLVVNGSAGAETLRYQGLPETRYLLGASYMLLRPLFARQPAKFAPSQTVQRVLVLTGGGEFSELARRIVDTTLRALPKASVDVILGPFGAVPAFDRALEGRVTVHRNPHDYELYQLMLQSDLAITGAGQSAYELAATATPMLGLLLVQNQTLNLRGLTAAGVMRNLGSVNEPDWLTSLASALEAMRDPAARAEMGARGRRLVDGRGAERVSIEIERLVVAHGVRS